MVVGMSHWYIVPLGVYVLHAKVPMSVHETTGVTTSQPGCWTAVPQLLSHTPEM